MNHKSLLILNGSPRKKGTSYSFARTFKMLSEEMGCPAQIEHVYDYFDEKEDFNTLLKLIEKSEIIALIAPLYVDALPYPDIWLLEKLANQHASILKNKSFFAVAQFGFPDITRGEPLLNACKFFCEEADMKWLGGLAYGGGAMLNGTRIEDLGKKGEKIISAFNLALLEVFKDQMIPLKSQELITVKIPKFLYRPLAICLNKMSKEQAKKHGVKNIKVKAYLV